MSRKADLLEERKQKWSSSQRVSEITEQARKVGEGEEEIGAAATHSILHRLTDKLTEHVRSEVQRELSSMKNVDVRELVAEKMESYLEAELSTHTCKICFELMTSPLHTPILLFPCGHTFCQQCMDTHNSISDGKKTSTALSTGSGNKTCPYCRTRIESRAVNQSLKDLIDQFSKQRLMVQNAAVKNLDDLFPSTVNNSPNSRKRHGNHRQSYERLSEVPSSSGSSCRESGRFAAQLKSCEMRHTILRNERKDLEEGLAAVVMRRKKISDASEHLQQERVNVEARLQLLLEERDLIDQHLAQQKSKQKEAAIAERSMREQVEMVDATIKSLQNEINKLRLLVEGADQS